MSLIGYQDGAAMFDVTPVENMFLIEYLPSAPEEFLRVYLYARMLCQHPELGDGMEDLARTLHMEQETLESAFRYWEQQGLMERLSDRPVSYAMIPMRKGSASVSSQQEYELQDMNLRLQGIFGANLLHPAEYLIASEWVRDLKFSQDAVVLFVENGAKKSKAKKPDLNRLFKKLDKEAARLADKGVKSAMDMERALMDGGADDVADAVLKRLSLRRAATADELSLARKWVEEWGFDREGVLIACQDTVKAREPSFAYLDRILDSRRQGDTDEGIRQVLTELGAPLPPSPEQRKRYRAFLAEGFEPRTVELAAIQTNLKRKHGFDDLCWMLSKWRDAGIFSAAAAEDYIREKQALRDEMRRLLESAGSEKTPSMGDIESLEKWKARYSPELISYAASCARGMQMPVKYMEKLLSSWVEAGVGDVAAAEAERARRGEKTPDKAGNPALNYAQTPASEFDFGSDFYVKLDDGGTP